MGRGENPHCYYVVRARGLFSAPLPQDREVCKVCSIFWKYSWPRLYKTRLVDLSLSPAFLKLLCGGAVSGCKRKIYHCDHVQSMYSPELLEDVMTSSLLSVVTE